MRSWISGQSLVSNKYERGLVDTSVLIGLGHVASRNLPREVSVSAITMAELAAGPFATTDANERARRQDRLQRAESIFEATPVDINVARAYGRVYAAVAAMGRNPRGRRVFDLLIAATALAENLPLFTANPDDFVGLESLIEVVPVLQTDE